MDAHKDPDPDPKKIGPDPQNWFVVLLQVIYKLFREILNQISPVSASCSQL